MLDVWSEFLKIINQEAGSQVVETWFKSVGLRSWDSTTSTVILSVPNQFIKRWIQDNYLNLLQMHLSRLLHANNLNFIFLCGTAEDQPRNIIPAATTQLVRDSEDIEQPSNVGKGAQLTSETRSIKPRVVKQNGFRGFNEGYTFDSFIVGPSNSLAHAAAKAVVDNLGKVYNPLFIYGGTGLGKTHLLHAIGNTVQRKYPNLQVVYETTDHFVNDFINSIRFDRADQFRNKYQKLDLLLIDDVQFLSNKEQTQEIFFHIFNLLHQNQKQIIMSSDTFPKEITGLQNRLKSRLEWGLVADIQMPDLETKIAILKKKADQNKIELPESVAYFISSCVISNIRELEGALIRVSAFAGLTNKPITLELAKRVLLNLNQKQNENTSLEKVLRVCAKHLNVAVNELKSRKRNKDVAEARQIIFYMMKKFSTNSLQIIGGFVGGRDHSTVIHAINKVDNLIKYDVEFAQKLKIIEQAIMMD